MSVYKLASKTEKKEIPLGQQVFAPLQYSILEKLKEFGPMTRDDLCEGFGFGKHKTVSTDKYLLREKGLRYQEVNEQYDKRTTIYDNLKKLEKQKLVEKFSRSNGKRGRSLVFWKIKELAVREFLIKELKRMAEIIKFIKKLE